MYEDLIRQAQEKRNKAHTAMSELVTRAQGEKRELSGEEKISFDRMGTDFEEASTEMRRYEALKQQDQALRQVAAPAVGAELPTQREQRSGAPNASEEYRSAFFEYARQGASADVRSLLEGTPSAGGYLAPISFESRLLELLPDENVMRLICEVDSMGSREHTIPVVTSRGSATWLDEEGKYVESDDDFEQIMLKARKLGRIIKVSEELLEDNQYDLEGYLARSFAQCFGSAEEAGFISGDGTKGPKGFLGSVKTTLTTKAAAAITYDDLVTTKFGIKAGYRKNGVWLLADTAALQISLLKDGEGRPIWQPSVQAGQPDILLGRPAHYSSAMPEFQSGKTPVAFGDFKTYRIADRSGFFLQRLVEKYADFGQVGFRGRRRVDGALLVPEAITALKVQ